LVHKRAASATEELRLAREHARDVQVEKTRAAAGGGLPCKIYFFELRIHSKMILKIQTSRIFYVFRLSK
jgi:hypothetical protein